MFIGPKDDKDRAAPSERNVRFDVLAPRNIALPPELPSLTEATMVITIAFYLDQV